MPSAKPAAEPADALPPASVVAARVPATSTRMTLLRPSAM
jgi:hypothetical protein